MRLLDSACCAALLAIATGSGPASACGYHDSIQLRRGIMNWAYPDSLHVGTAVWSAQLDGRLAREARPAGYEDLTPDARNQFAFLKATRLLGQLRASLESAQPGNQRNMAVVLLGPMLWSRYVADGSDVRLETHVDGPAAGDVVIVTEAAVIEALVNRTMTAEEAVRQGLLRFYGDASRSNAVRAWMAAMAN